MNCFKKLALATAVSSVVGIAGCGGSSGGSSSDSNTASGETISGTATAPAGTVAHWQEPGLMEVAVNFLVSPAAAAITGLQPVQGANVELIRVDDDGNQIGNILATTSTSISGDYTLTLPEGVNLAGNLVVRITGQNNQQLRAQVVEKDVDISPVSEFVLRKFIETGANLDQLVVTDVVKLSGKVEEYDLTKVSGQNLDAMFTSLENEVGTFIENDVVAISAQGAATASIAGSYINTAFAFALHDTDGNGYGTYAHDTWIDRFTFTAGDTGTVNVNFTTSDSAYANLHGTALDQAMVYYEVDSEQLSESFEGSYTTAGVLSVEGEFEEDLDTDSGFGWRWPGQSYIFQQVSGQGMFIGLNHEAGVRYELTDTDNDGQDDALDPNARSGDEVARTLEIFIRQPTSLTPADVQGDYGRVYLSALLEDGYLELMTETNLVEFTGTFEATGAAGTSHELMVNSNGAAAYTTNPFSADTTSTPIPIAADGSIDFGDGVVGQANESGSFIDFTETDGCNAGSLGCGQSEAGFDKTLLVKLPSTQLDLLGKKYRLMFMAMHLDGGGTNNMVLSATRFNTYMNMTSDSAGTISGTVSELEKPTGLGSDLVSVTGAISEQAFTISVAPNGSTTVTIPSDQAGEETVFEGYFNEDGSLGVFTTGYVEAGGDRDELGLAVLIDVTP
ncbi:hypothetical protein [Marinobacter nauticus]|uniref:hypothetical protein n=1 Tax=Marinobacter nauticus TaxID=2743 RepID=UPI000EB1F2A3|nr:hypothetical protein [Marinobacter nauticus]RKR72573.1 hypothetical protein C7436_2935 [Marinobacter nauticus]